MLNKFFILVGEELSVPLDTWKSQIDGCPIRLDISMNDVSLDDP